MRDFSFKRQERLKSQKTIGKMFSQGQSLGQYPLRLIWLKVEEEEAIDIPVQIAFTVPKKRYKRAVHRNRIKRQMKEAYRLRKPKLYQKLEELEGRLAFMIIYTGKEQLPFEDIQLAMKQLLGRFLKKYKKFSTQPTKPLES